MDKRSSQSGTDNSKRQAYQEAAERIKQQNEEKMIARHQQEVERAARMNGITNEEAQGMLKQKHEQEWYAYYKAAHEQKQREEANMGRGYE